MAKYLVSAVLACKYGQIVVEAETEGAAMLAAVNRSDDDWQTFDDYSLEFLGCEQQEVDHGPSYDRNRRLPAARVAVGARVLPFTEAKKPEPDL